MRRSRPRARDDVTESFTLFVFQPRRSLAGTYRKQRKTHRRIVRGETNLPQVARARFFGLKSRYNDISFLFLATAANIIAYAISYCTRRVKRKDTTILRVFSTRI